MLQSSKDLESAPLGANDLIRLARDFGVFAVLMFPELHDGKQMVPASYVNLMAEALMAMWEGREKRFIFNLPPGHMKSLIVSVLFTAWLLGVEPAKRILCISYGEDLDAPVVAPDAAGNDVTSLPSNLSQDVARQAGGGSPNHHEGRATPGNGGWRSRRGLRRRTDDH
jgi:hypothetical protein